MSKILDAATAITTLRLVAMSTAHARAINDNHHHYFRPGYAGPLSSSADARGSGFSWSARHRDGYDGGRYWWGGDCWPTEPGGCD
jgi:hypothetical protein